MKHKTLTILLYAVACVLSRPTAAPASIVDGSCLEAWELTNYQTSSPTYQQKVHSSSYHGRTTLVVYLASW